MIRSPEVLGEGFASDLLELEAIEDAAWTTVANVIATAIEEDRLQYQLRFNGVLALAVARGLADAGIIERIYIRETADLIAAGIDQDRHLRPRQEEETLP